MTELTYIFAFGLAAVSDFIWSCWISAVHAKRPLAAGLWSAGTLLVGSIHVILITSDPWLIPAELAGGFLGAYYAVKTKPVSLNVTQE